jgi:signal transduction histidine kinase
VRARTEQLGTLLAGFAEVYRLPLPRLADADLGGLARDAALLLRARANEYAVVVTVDEAAAWPTVAVDRVQVGHVIVNIVKNAIEAAGRGGWVRIRPGAVDGRPALIVEDSGPGLSPEARDNLFTPFFSTKDGGQGIGLTFVQEVLGRHGCDFSLEAREHGPMTFTIVFRQR